MTPDDAKRTNWFDKGGRAYVRFRPDYPPELAEALARAAPSHRLAVDVGCGNGQLTRQLAGHFQAVIGVDPSADQLANAHEAARVTYRRAPAEALPVADASAGLVAAAQAAHWFDLPAFYAEARRIAEPGAAIALVSYGVPEVGRGAVKDRFARFYRDEIGPFWPPERRLVESGYADLDFPFAERPGPRLSIARAWDLDALLGYVSTWSAVRRAAEAGRGAILNAFADDLSALWGEPDVPQGVAWPIRMRLGTI